MNGSIWSALLTGADYGLYVWAAYIVAFVVVMSEIVVLRFSRHSILEHLGRFSVGRRNSRRTRRQRQPHA